MVPKTDNFNVCQSQHKGYNLLAIFLQTIMKVIALVALLVVAVAAQKKSVVDLDRNNNGIDDRREVWWPRRAGKCVATLNNLNFPKESFYVEINLDVHHCSLHSQSCLLFTHGNTAPEILTIIYFHTPCYCWQQKVMLYSASNFINIFPAWPFQCLNFILELFCNR